MENNKTVCAVVVTYNRKALLIECLNGLLNQTKAIDAIYLIDNNSSDGTEELLYQNNFIKELPPKNFGINWEIKSNIKNTFGTETVLHYIKMSENLGGAGGFYQGMKSTYEKGYDYIWVMDDDAEPLPNSYEVLFNNILENSEYPAYATSVVQTTQQIDLGHRGIIDFENMFPAIQKPVKMNFYSNTKVEIETASFVGLLIKRGIIDEIGLPKKEFFIHNDDIEYCLRINKIGKILLIPESKIIHKEVSIKEKLRITPYDKLWLKYFSVRNIIILSEIYSTNKFKFKLKVFKYFIKELRKILFYGDNKFKRIKFLYNQILDGFKGITDNNKPKKILY